MPRLTAEPEDYTSLIEPKLKLEGYTPFPEQEQDEDKLSLITEETDLAGPLTQSFAAYGFNPFEPRPTEKTKEFISFPFPPLPSTSTISQKKMAQDDVNMADGTKDTEIKMNMPKPFTGKRDELKRFMQNCKIYLQINKKKYDTDLTKIGFVLALMKRPPSGQQN